MKHINDKNYNEIVMNNTSPFILYFKSNTCPHCITVNKYLERIDIDKQKPCNFNIFYIQAEESPKLLELYGVRSFPTTFFIKEDKSVNVVLIGAEQFEKFINETKNICSNKKKKFFGIF